MSGHSIPVSLLFFTSTKGHWGFRDIYKTTLALLDRQIPLVQFNVKVAHIKVTPGEEIAAHAMTGYLESIGFKVLTTSAEWSHNTSHGNQYLRDIITMSRESSIYSNPHVWWWEDDWHLDCHQDRLDTVLSRMTRFVDSSPDHLSTRFILRSAYEGGVANLGEADADSFFSPFTDFQPAIWRSRDFYLAAKTIEDNWDKVQGIHIEQLWRMVTDPLSRSQYKHKVWLPNYAEPIHLGCPEYPSLKAALLG